MSAARMILAMVCAPLPESTPLEPAPTPEDIVIMPLGLPTGTVGTAYGSQLLTAEEATGAVTWSIVTGSLPPGLAFNTSTGVISGTPSTAGTFTFKVKAVDSTAREATRTYSVEVVNAVAVATTYNGIGTYSKGSLGNDTPENYAYNFSMQFNGRGPVFTGTSAVLQMFGSGRLTVTAPFSATWELTYHSANIYGKMNYTLRRLG